MAPKATIELDADEVRALQDSLDDRRQHLTWALHTAACREGKAILMRELRALKGLYSKLDAAAGLRAEAREEIRKFRIRRPK